MTAFACCVFLITGFVGGVLVTNTALARYDRHVANMKDLIAREGWELPGRPTEPME